MEGGNIMDALDGGSTAQRARRKFVTSVKPMLAPGVDTPGDARMRGSPYIPYWRDPSMDNVRLNPTMAVIITVLIGGWFFLWFVSVFIRKPTTDETTSTTTTERSRSLSSEPCGLDKAAIDALPVIHNTHLDERDDLKSPIYSAAQRDDDLLESKHSNFLSHSGAQKSFVGQLCLDLEAHDRYPFFDKRRDSLSIACNFPNLIFEAINQCQVAVVILSEELFSKSKWPMLELAASVFGLDTCTLSPESVP